MSSHQISMIRRLTVVLSQKCDRSMLQRIFGTKEFGSSKNLKNSFVLLGYGRDKNTKLWGAKVMLLFWLHVKGCEEGKNFSFEQYKDVTSLLDNVDSPLVH